MTSSLYEPLFLKYRPQALADVMGQNSVKETLINAINNQKIVHAYLLIGPRGSGKTSTARIIAKSLNCLDPLDKQSPSTQPCGKCESCTGITNSSSMDVTEIDAASHGHVEDARKLIERVNLASVSGKYRIYIIDEVHMLTSSAFNALLKVVEEPPANVIFILATTEVDKVPKTIASRCQQLKFKPISINDAITRLKYVAEKESINIDDEALKIIAGHSDGAMRDALSLLDQLSVFSSESSIIDSKKVLEIIGAIPTNDLNEICKAILLRDAAATANKLDELLINGKDPVIISQEISNYLLGLLEAKNQNDKNERYSELINLCTEHLIENYELVQIVDSLNELEFRLKSTTQSKNLIKAWFIKITYRADILVVKDLLARIEKLENSTKNSSPTINENKPKVEQFQSPKPRINVDQVNLSPVEIKTPIAKDEPSITSNISSQNTSFLDYLSPQSKGLCISSQAQLINIQNDTAYMQVPSKFKFLKTKLDSKIDEICSAISKASGQTISKIEIEVVEQLSPAAPSPRQS